MGVQSAAALVVCLLLFSSSGGANSPGPTLGGPLAGLNLRAVLGPATQLPGGLFRVSVPGPDLITHGPDPRPEANGTSRGLSYGPGDPERQPVCTSDSTFQKILYARGPADPNLNGAIVERIRASIRRADAELNRQSLADAHVTADYEVLCDKTGDIRIDQFNIPARASFGQVVRAARDAGASMRSLDYTIFSSEFSSAACGIGTMSPDSRPGPGNRNNNPGGNVPAGYALIFNGCWDGDSVMHENGHNEGAVQSPAPGSTGRGRHCWIENDVMCYSPDGGSKHQNGTKLKCSREEFDCFGDTYFNPAPRRGGYLRKHWNIGSTANHFIVFNAHRGRTPGKDLIPRTIRSNSRYNGSSAIPGGWRYYRIKVPRPPRKHSRLTVSLREGACRPSNCNDLGLRMRRTGFPYWSPRGCTVHHGQGASESCVFGRPENVYWYIGVNTVSGPSGVPYELKAVFKY